MENIVAQFGDQENRAAHGFDMRGYSAYQECRPANILNNAPCGFTKMKSDGRESAGLFRWRAGGRGTEMQTSKTGDPYTGPKSRYTGLTLTKPNYPTFYQSFANVS